MTTCAAPDTEPGHAPGSREHRRVAWALFVAGVATFSLLYSVQALLPELAASYDVTAAQSTLALSLTTVALGATLLVAGTLSEVVGRTPLIHASLLGAAAVAAACALAPSWPALLALRLLEGVALAGLPAVATAYLREELHPSSHARAAGLYVGGTALGGMTGRLLPGAIAEAAGWRWGLAAAAALALGCALAVRALLPASRHFSPVRPDPRALARMVRDGLRDRGLLALYGIGGCTMGAFVAVLNATGFRLAAAPFHLGVGTASLVFLVYPLGSVAAAVAGRLADRFGRRPVLPLGCAVAVGGLLVTLAPSLPLTVVGLAVLTCGFFTVHGVASGWVPARAHAAGVAAGPAASLYLSAYYLGASVFGSLAGGVWTHHGWPGVVTLAGVLLGGSGLLAGVLRRTPALVTPPARTGRQSPARRSATRA